MRKCLTILLLLLPLPALAEAQKPAEISNIIQASAPHGKGALTRLFITAYDAELWMDAPVWSMKTPFALSLNYRMGFSSEELVERTIKEMQRIPGVDAAQLKDYPTQLQKWFPAVRNGDRITAVYVPQKGTSFYYNHTLTGKSTDDVFAQRFFAIWLGPNSSEPALRQSLLQP